MKESTVMFFRRFVSLKTSIISHLFSHCLSSWSMFFFCPHFQQKWWVNSCVAKAVRVFIFARKLQSSIFCSRSEGLFHLRLIHIYFSQALSILYALSFYLKIIHDVAILQLLLWLIYHRIIFSSSVWYWKTHLSSAEEQSLKILLISSVLTFCILVIDLFLFMIVCLEEIRGYFSIFQS